jgi:UDP-glucose 4-epimerase
MNDTTATPDRTALLTGSTGFIGHHLLASLHEQGYQVRTLNRSSAAKRADLLEPDSLLPLCEGVDTVFHLAAYAHINHADDNRLRAVNVDGTANLLRAACSQGVKHFIFMSSIKADPAHDQPRTAYGQSKYDAEQLLLAAHRAGDIRVCILRPVNVYGPQMKGNLLSMIRMIRRGFFPPLPRNDQPLSLIGVHDLCEAVVCAAHRLQEDASEQVFTPVYPVTDGTRYTVKSVEGAIREAFDMGQPDWSMPAPGLYLAALGMELLGRLFRLKNAPGLRSYRALTQGSFVDDTTSREYLRYNPGATFYSALPDILDALGVAHKADHMRNRNNP